MKIFFYCGINRYLLLLSSLFISITSIHGSSVASQLKSSYSDSLLRVIKNESLDSATVNAMHSLALYYMNGVEFNDSCFMWIAKADSLSRKIKFESGIALSPKYSLEAKLKMGKWFAENNKSNDAENTFLYIYSKAENTSNTEMQLNAAQALSHLYARQKKFDKAFYYQELHYALKDSFIKINSGQTIETLRLRVELEKKQSAIDLLNAKQEKNKIFMYAMISIVVLLIVVAIAIYRRYKERAKTEKILEQTNEELRQSVKHLHEAEKQLVNSEKMSSLGRLSAAIAHELRNPLNFVINFSETSCELTDEVLHAATLEDKNQSAKDLVSNVQKIGEHSLRANKIINNMLQHERKEASNLQATNINDLCSECIDLAVNGLKSSGKIFDGRIIKLFDSNLPEVVINKEDISSVLINLMSNALYAVLNAKKTTNHYEPTIEIITSRDTKKIIVSVSDNGMGISKAILEKVFEPFFTTKAVNEGTGLGLSICYDIIKNHNGNISVESKEGDGTKFTFWLPE